MSSRRVVASLWFTSGRRRGAMRVGRDWLRSRRHRPPSGADLTNRRDQDRSEAHRNGAVQPYLSEVEDGLYRADL